MSGGPYSQKSRWIKHSNEHFPGSVIANIAQSLIGDLEHIIVAHPWGVQGVRPTLPAIKYSMKMK